MDLNKIKRRKSEKKVMISIRISRDLSEWLRKMDYSPTGLFLEAVKDLGYIENKG